jgi:ankyrin repeat protein
MRASFVQSCMKGTPNVLCVLALAAAAGAAALHARQAPTDGAQAAGRTAAAAVHAAAFEGDLGAVQAFVAKDQALASAKDAAGRAPLHAAAGAGRDTVVTYLLSAGVDANGADNSGATALHLAAAGGHDEVARLLIDKNAVVDAQDSGRETPLAKACARGRVQVATRLLAAGASVDTANSYGRTPLSLVARESGNVELARMLIDRKAEVNPRDKFGDTPLQLAAWRGFRPVVDLLIERGASVPSDARARSQLIGQAAQNALESLFTKLLDIGVGVPAAVPGRRSLLHDAAAGGSVRILERLLAAAPAINQADGDGWTPLHDAAFMARQEAIGLLLDKGADPNRRNRLGQSPWNIAVEHKRAGVPEYLASRGADQSAPRFPALTGDYFGQTPPGREPQVFAPGIVGGHFQLHSSIAFSPDGSEAYWSEMIPPTSPGYGTGRTMVSRRVNGRWTHPEVAMVGSRPMDDVPVVSGDGRRLYDMSRRPLPGTVDAAPKENIWVAERAGTGWGEPRPLDQTVNALPQHWQFAVDKDGGVCFSSNWKGARGLFYSPLARGRHADAVPLDAPINANGSEGMPFIAKDGSYLLFSRDMDIWVSFRGPDGAWKAPVRLPSPINTEDAEICPTVSPDGRYLFFLRGELMWVDARTIEPLR